nr:hypothetical protein [uncultured Acetobacteroides sp.]
MFWMVVFSLSIVSCSTKQVENDRTRQLLKGEVKSIIETCYSLSGKRATVVNFTTSGFVSKQSGYNPDGSLIRTWIFEYNMHNQPIKKICYVMNDSLSYITRYFYNKMGKLNYTIQLNSNGYSYVDSRFIYDSNKNKAEEFYYSSKKNASLKITYKYDKENRIIEQVFVDSTIHQTWRQINKYSSGLLTESANKTMYDSLLLRQTYTYDEKDRIVDVRQFDGRNRPIMKTSYVYDSHGNKTKVITLSGDNSIKERRTYVYKYDKHGNYTFLLEYVNGDLECTTTRDIQYYN